MKIWQQYCNENELSASERAQGETLFRRKYADLVESGKISPEQAAIDCAGEIEQAIALDDLKTGRRSHQTGPPPQFKGRKQNPNQGGFPVMKRSAP